MSTHPCIPGRTRATSVSVNSVSASALREAGERAGPFILLALTFAREGSYIAKGALLSVRRAVELHRDLGRHIDEALSELGAVGDSKPPPPIRHGRGLDAKKRRGHKRRIA
jgi:hypothetical protein